VAGCDDRRRYAARRHGSLRRALGVSKAARKARRCDWCGEWQDKNITPEQAERRELVKQFAAALVASGSHNMVHQIWQRAAELAEYEGQE